MSNFSIIIISTTNSQFHSPLMRNVNEGVQDNNYRNWRDTVKYPANFYREDKLIKSGT